MTEKRFKEVFPDIIESSCSFTDNGKGITHKEVVDLLNELNDENKQLRLQLNLCSDQRNEFHRGARENANRVGKLEKENEQLKQQRDFYYVRLQKIIKIANGDFE